MSIASKPLKRSRHLATLSHEHHEILLFVWKIRQGVLYKVPAAEIGKYCAWFWDYMLKEHCEKEDALFPGLFADDDILLGTMRDDHNAIAKKMQEVIEDPSYFQIQRLAQIIYYHVRFEERVWFKHVEHTLNDSKLNEIDASLSTNKIKRKMTWQNEFWRKRA